MRFLPTALAALLAFPMIEAGKVTLSDAQMNAMVANGQVDQKKLFANAIPVGRNLQNNGNNGYSANNAANYNNQNNQNAYGNNNNQNAYGNNNNQKNGYSNGGYSNYGSSGSSSYNNGGSSGSSSYNNGGNNDGSSSSSSSGNGGSSSGSSNSGGSSSSGSSSSNYNANGDYNGAGNSDSTAYGKYTYDADYYSNLNYYSPADNQKSNYNAYSSKSQYGQGGYYADGQYQNEGNNVDFSIQGNHQIRFSSCMSLSVQDDELLEDRVLFEAASQGKIVAQQSYVLFTVECADSSDYDCKSDYTMANNEFMVPLETFIDSMIELYPTQREDLCNVCGYFFNYCASYAGQKYSHAKYMNNGNFCYEGDQYKLIDCSDCQNMGCYSGISGQIPKWAGGEWVEELASCRETGTQWNGINLYAGMMCNAAGDGVEFGVFADDNCRFYHKEKNFHKVMNGDDWKYYNKVPPVIEHLLSSPISCKSLKDVRYYNVFQPVYQDDGECGDEENINDACLDLFSDMTLDLHNCQAQQANDWYDADTYQSQYNEVSMQLYWKQQGLYSYQIAGGQLDDAASVCNVVRNEASNGAHENVYDPAASGSMFDYGSATGRYNVWGVKMDTNFLSKEDKITIGSVLGVAALLALLGYCRYRQSKRPEEIIVMADSSDKELPLVS